jgi:hypothetical protein
MSTIDVPKKEEEKKDEPLTPLAARLMGKEEPVFQFTATPASLAVDDKDVTEQDGLEKELTQVFDFGDKIVAGEDNEEEDEPRRKAQKRSTEVIGDTASLPTEDDGPGVERKSVVTSSPPAEENGSDQIRVGDRIVPRCGVASDLLVWTVSRLMPQSQTLHAIRSGVDSNGQPWSKEKIFKLEVVTKVD